MYKKRNTKTNMTMKQTHVLIALLLFLQFYDASTDKPPKIVGPDHVHLKAKLGSELVLDCKAKPNCDNDVTMIYWLVNGTFPEYLDTPRISETEESSLGGIVQRDLVLKNVTTEDLTATFVCVVMNPEGVAKKHVFLGTHLKKAIKVK